MKGSSGEATRLAAAHAVLGGTAFRRKVIERASDRYHAVAPELGLDLPLVLQVALWMENRRHRYDWFFLAGIVLSSVGFAVARPVGVLLVLGMAVVAVRKRLHERFELARSFRRDEYDPARVRERFPTEIPFQMTVGLPKPDQNVGTYSKFVPFNGAGFEVGAWSFVIDAARAKPSSGAPVMPTAFHVDELLAAVEEAIADLQSSRVRCRDYVLLHGTDAEYLGLLRDRFAAPVQHVSKDAFAGLRNSNSARRYKWIQIFDWGDELVLSNFLYSERVGDEVFVESRQFLLAPIAEAYRKVDQIPNRTVRTWLGSAVRALLMAPFELLGGPFSIFLRVQESLSEVFGSAEREIARAIEDGPRFNYGAATSLRQELAGTKFTHYFQRTDREMLVKLVDRRVLVALVDFLDSHGVDTSDIKESQSVIMNNGIIVHGGDVKADSMAVGQGARASGVFSRLRGQRAESSAASAVGGK